MDLKVDNFQKLLKTHGNYVGLLIMSCKDNSTSKIINQ